MSRKRLTTETLESVSRVASAREYARLAESILGPAATDREVLETAQRLSSMSLNQVRGINQRRQAIQHQTKRLAAVDGAEDPWGEAGPDQPDPTNNQAYTKQIMTTPDHAVLESLQKRDVHAPTASRASKLSRASRQKWGAQESDEDEDTDVEASVDEDDESDVEAGMEEGMEEGDVEAGEGGPEDHEHEIDLEGIEDDADGEFDGMDDEGVEGEFDDDLENLGPEEEGEEDDDEEPLDDMEGDEDDLDLDDERGDEIDDLMGDDEIGDEDEDDLEVFEDEGGGEDFGDEGLGDMDDEESLEEAAPPMPPRGSRQNRASNRRQASVQSSKGKSAKSKNSKNQKKRVAGAGSTKVSLDDILNLHDEDVAREASSALEGDDLDSLLGRKVQRAGNRVNTPVKATGSALASHKAMFERVWDNEHDSGGAPRRRQASQRKPVQQQQRRKIARSTQDFTEDEQAFARTQFKPDRRRVASRPSENEFDQVFKVPDVSRFFD